MNTEGTHRDTPWIKAKSSDGGGNCVEMRRSSGMVEVRDTKQHGQGPTLKFTSAEFAAFIDGAAKGEFDHLV